MREGEQGPLVHHCRSASGEVDWYGPVNTIRIERFVGHAVVDALLETPVTTTSQTDMFAKLLPRSRHCLLTVLYS